MGYNNINSETLHTVDGCADYCDSLGTLGGKFGNLTGMEECNLFQYVKLSKEHQQHYDEHFLAFMEKRNMTIPHEYIKHCIFYSFKAMEKPIFIFETENILKEFSYVCIKKHHAGKRN